MIKSMTGFGRYEYTDETCRFTVELKSVNHRYLDVTVKMPKKLNFFESSIRNLLKEYAERGKIDVFITYEDFSTQSVSLSYHENVAAQYLEYFKVMEKSFGLTNDIRVSTLARFPEVFTMDEQSIDEKTLWMGLEKALRGAAEQFVASRITEGAQLQNDLIGKLDQIMEYVLFIEERSPVIMEEYKEKLEKKVAELLDDRQIDESRIATEVTIFADKVCVDEEIVRLKSHIKATRDTLQTGGGIGRKLDFIAQEMNREANTILSKASDLAITDTGINLKTDIEKVREQIQNIE